MVHGQGERVRSLVGVATDERNCGVGPEFPGELGTVVQVSEDPEQAGFMVVWESARGLLGPSGGQLCDFVMPSEEGVIFEWATGEPVDTRGAAVVQLKRWVNGPGRKR